MYKTQTHEILEGTLPFASAILAPLILLPISAKSHQDQRR